MNTRKEERRTKDGQEEEGKKSLPQRLGAARAVREKSGRRRRRKADEGFDRGTNRTGSKEHRSGVDLGFPRHRPADVTRDFESFFGGFKSWLHLCLE